MGDTRRHRISVADAAARAVAQATSRHCADTDKVLTTLPIHNRSGPCTTCQQSSLKSHYRQHKVFSLCFVLFLSRNRSKSQTGSSFRAARTCQKWRPKVGAPSAALGQKQCHCLVSVLDQMMASDCSHIAEENAKI